MNFNGCSVFVVENIFRLWKLTGQTSLYFSLYFSYPSGYIEQKINFDFYNYAGINRDVKLYTTPETYIDDIAVKTILQDDGYAKVYYDVSVKPSTSKDVTCKISLLGTSASRQR